MRLLLAVRSTCQRYDHPIRLAPQIGPLHWQRERCQGKQAWPISIPARPRKQSGQMPTNSTTIPAAGFELLARRGRRSADRAVGQQMRLSAAGISPDLPRLAELIDVGVEHISIAGAFRRATWSGTWSLGFLRAQRWGPWLARRRWQKSATHSGDGRSSHPGSYGHMPDILATAI
jgi:hypothetical protein